MPHHTNFLLGAGGETRVYVGALFASFTLPEAAWELSLGVYLTVKGFKASHVLYDDGRRTNVDGPLTRSS